VCCGGCGVLWCVAMCVLSTTSCFEFPCLVSVLPYAVACCSVLQFVTVCYSELQCVVVCCGVLQCVCCELLFVLSLCLVYVLLCAAVFCSVL